jgi:hypothetical protein
VTIRSARRARPDEPQPSPPAGIGARRYPRLHQYRSRGYAAKRLQKVGTPLQVIMQVGGWKREAMPTRYIGKYDESELKAFPTADLRSLLRGA